MPPPGRFRGTIPGARLYAPILSNLSLTSGTRLGVYEITVQIGEGGMGQVWRGTDTTLGRQVAIKILPDAFAADPERLARFEREAKTLASLNHPHIAQIYGFEKSSGMHALVMELVEGDDLSQRIARGAIPLDEALPIAKQIAEALEAAHEQGIIHRDLKPANIKVRSDGTVKVLDFGLAKAMDQGSGIRDQGSAHLANSPTITTPAVTQAGMILGTAAYMSPEQARGTTVDKRADLWSFGVVLWEMLTGKRLFEGATVSDTLAAVLRAEPDLTALPPPTPALIRRLLRRCLEKDRKRRLDSAAAARLEVEEALSPPASTDAVAAQPRPVPRSTWSRALPWGVAGVALAGLLLTLALSALWPTASSPRDAALRFTPLSFEPGGQTDPVWSPDGKAVAFGARQNERDPYQIYVRYLDSPVATPITRLVTSGTPIEWTSAGRIVFHSTQAPAGLWSVSPVGGEPQPLHAIKDERAAESASASRDGSALAWWDKGDDGVFTVLIASPPGAEPKPYQPAPFATRNTVASPTVKFSPDGKQLLLIRNAAGGPEAWLLPYPASETHPPHRTLERVPMHSGGTPTFSWMPDSRHVVLATPPYGGGPDQLYIADTTSETFAVLAGGTTAQRRPAVSPDGSRLVFQEFASDYDVVSVDLATAAITSLVATQRSEQMPAWAYQEAALVYVTDRSGAPEVWLHEPGQLDRPLVTARDFPPDTTDAIMGPVLSPDATRVIYTRLERNGPGRAWISAVAGGSPVRLVKTSAERDWPGSWSPDGNWFVYLHLRDGKYSLNKVKTTGQAEPEVLTASWRSTVPVWSPAGDWIMYRSSAEGSTLISPDGGTTRDFPNGVRAYAFSADGQTIYSLRQVGNDGLELFSTGINGGGEKTIGSLPSKYLPAVSNNPSVRLSLAPDGKSLTYSTVKNTSNLWLIEGIDAVTLPK